MVELLVVLAIVVSITSVVLTNQGAFNKTLVLSNTAYDVALSLRSAQMYGIGGRAMSVAPTGYGIHFDMATPNSFLLFADAYPAPTVQSTMCHIITDAAALDAHPGDCIYESGSDLMVTKYTLGNSITLTDFCVYVSNSATPTCASSGGGGLSTLDIVFARPNPDPLMSANGVYSALSPITSACLTLSSPLGGDRYVLVSSSGRILANAPSCP